MTEEKREVIIREEALLGDLISVALDRIKELDRPWHKLSEAEQQRVIDGLEYYFKDAASQACNFIEGYGTKTFLRATLDQVTIKDGIKAVLKIDGDDEGRHELADHQGQNVAVVICDVAGSFTSEGKPQADKDQPDLQLDEEKTDHSKTESALADALEGAE